MGPEGGAKGAGLRGLAFIAIGVLFFSTSPVLVRWAAPLSPFEITFGRMATAAVVVGLVVALRRGNVGLRRSDLPRFALFGLVTGLHFLLYVASLSFTTIAHSLSLTYTSPIFVALFSALFLKESMPPRKYLGVLVAVVGVAVLVGFEPHLTPAMLFGDLLALGSAVCFGFYSIIGRSQRARYPLLSYALGAYGFAALWLLPSAGLQYTGSFSIANVMSVAALGIFPLALGHTLYNASLRRVHATYVNLIATQEATGGILLGWLLLNEAPTPNAWVGWAITLAGVALVLIPGDARSGED